MSIETYGSPILADVALNDDGTLKQSGKQNIRFYNKKIADFRAKQLRDEEGNAIFEFDAKGRKVPVFEMDSRTGLPKKEIYERIVEMVRVETKGDTNIKDDVANEIDRQQHYRHYKFFREGKIPDGNPIEDFEYIQPTTYTELHMMGVHVIQQAALMNDVECERVQGQSGFEIRDFAVGWVRINTPQGQAGKANRLELEVERLKRTIEDLQGKGKTDARNEMLREQREAASDEPSEFETTINTMVVSSEDFVAGKRRGRPRKV